MEQLGPFLLERELGAGAEARVYRSRDPITGESVALKVWPAHADGGEHLRELRLLRDLSHPGLVRVRDAFSTSRGLAVLVMDLIEGAPFTSEFHRLSERERLETSLRLAEALAYLHEQGFVHGDVKPDNVRIATSGPVLLDFGLCEQRDRSTLVGGTPAYLAPELTDGRSVPTPRSDLFSLGVTLLQGLLGTDLPRRSVPEGIATSDRLGRLLQAMLSRSPDRRPRSAGLLVERLREALGPEGSLRLPSRWPFVGHERERARASDALAALASGTSLALGLAIVGDPGSGRRRMVEELVPRIRALGLDLLRHEEASTFESTVRTWIEVSMDETATWDPRGDEGGDPVERAEVVLDSAAKNRPMVIAGPREGADPNLRRLIERLTAREQRRIALGEPRRWLQIERTYEQRSGPWVVLTLRPWSPSTVRAVVAEALGARRSDRAVRSLSAWISARSGGRPKSVDAALRGLVRRGILRRDGDGLDFREQEAASLEVDEAVGSGLSLTIAELLPTERRLLEILGIAYDDLSLGGLARLGGIPEATAIRACDALIVRDLVRRRRDRVHVLGEERRVEILASLDESQRRALHRDMATETQGVERWRHLLAADDVATLRDAIDSEVECGEASPAREVARFTSELRAAEVLQPWPARLLLLEARALQKEGRTPEARTLLRSLLDSDDDEISVSAALALVFVTSSMGEAQAARHAIDEALRRARRPEQRVRSLGMSAFLSLRAGDVEDARREAEEAIKLAAREDAATAVAHNVIGLLEMRAGRWVAAEEAFERAQALLLASGRAAAAAVAQSNRANLRMRRGDPSSARRLLEESVRVLVGSGDRTSLGEALNNLAIVASELGDLEGAVRTHRDARRLHRDAGDISRSAQSLAGEGIAWLQGGHPWRASPALRQAASDLSSGDVRVQVLVLVHRAKAAAQLGRRVTARTLAARALRWSRHAGSARLLAESWLAAAVASDSSKSRQRRSTRAERAAVQQGEKAMRDEIALIDAEHRTTPLPEPASVAPRLRAALWLALARRARIRGDRVAERAALARSLAAWRRGRNVWLGVSLALAVAQRSVEDGRLSRAARQLARLRSFEEEWESHMTTRSSAWLRLTLASAELARLEESLNARLAASRRGGEAAASVELTTVLDAVSALASELRSSDLLDRMIDGVFQITGAETAFVVLREGPGGLRFAASRRRDGRSVKAPDDEVSRSIIAESMAEGAVLVVADAAADAEYGRLASVRGADLRSLCLVPMVLAGERLGVLYLDGGSVPGVFREQDIPVLEAFARLCALALRNALRQRTAEVRHSALSSSLRTERARRLTAAKEHFARGALVGSSAPMRRLDRLLDRAATSDLPVLVLGESGTGKELVARELHRRIHGTNEPFIAVECAALPESLVESELFGVRRGAFSGADEDRPGLFTVAGEGTLFLDELIELPLAAQSKLLRVLQEREFRPLGSETTEPLLARVVAATHGDLRAAVAAGSFREDLFHRLDVLRLEVPPLRERREDIPLLVAAFLAREGIQKRLNGPAMEALVEAEWPGNVRQLENEVRRAVLFADDDLITTDALSPRLRGAETSRSPFVDREGKLLPLEEIERSVIRAALAHTGQDRSLTARLLGISRSTLYKKMETLDSPEDR